MCSVPDPTRIAQSSVFRIMPPADACGVCGGNSSSCRGCDGVPNSGLEYDACGVCGGSATCLGCDLVPNSGKVADICGVCEGSGDSCRGCDGVPRPDGGIEADSCGNCGGSDNSCSRPPSMGILPSIHGYACAGSEGSNSNRLHLNIALVGLLADEGMPRSHFGWKMMIFLLVIRRQAVEHVVESTF